MGSGKASRAALLAAVLAGCVAEPEAPGTPGPASSDDWMRTVQSAIATSEYQPRPGPGWALKLSNRTQGLRARLDDGAIEISAQRRGGVLAELPPADFELRLQTVAWGREGALREVPSSGFEVGACVEPVRRDARGDCLRRAERDAAGLTEWWTNTEAGLEHGWTLHERPAGDRLVSITVAVGTDWALESPDRVRFRGVGGAASYGGLRAWDSAGGELPVRFDATGAGLSIVVDDADARWPIHVDPLLTTEAWGFESNQAGANLASVASAGDLNGDGFDDVVAGAPEYNGAAGSETGKVWVFFGSASGPPTSADWSWEGPAGAKAGSSVAGAGDVDGDGIGDLLVGAGEWDGSVTDEGAALIFYGSSSGLPAAPDWTVVSGDQGSDFGESVASAGDVNGDGYADVLVGAKDFNSAGRVFFYFGGASGPPASANWTADGAVSISDFGSTVAGLGDVNGDGYGDFAVGDPAYSSGSPQEAGMVVVYHGSPSGPVGSWTEYGEGYLDGFGGALSGVGDVNGDGYADVGVGSPNYAGSNIGKAYVFYGSATGVVSGSPWEVPGTSGQNFGAAVQGAGDINADGYADLVVTSSGGSVYGFLGGSAGPSTSEDWLFSSGIGTSWSGHTGAGDFNGDGFADLLLGSWNWGSGQSNEGRVTLYYGAGSGLPTGTSWTNEPDQANAYLGYSVASAGDVNGDGYDDVVVGAYEYANGEGNEGAAFVFHGTATGVSSSASWSTESNQSGAWLGYSVASAGDVNGDGYADLLVGVPSWDNGQSNEGGAFVYLGSPSGLASTAAWTGESNQADASYGHAVDSAGDVNADGYDDVVVGAYRYEDGETDEGRAYLYLGSASGLASSASWTSEIDQAGASWGYSVAGVGDVDADGYDDVLIGARDYDDGETDEGAVFLYDGYAGGLMTSSSWNQASDQDDAWFGHSIAGCDVNGDGAADLIVGAPGYENAQNMEGWAFAYHSLLGSPVSVESWSVESNNTEGQLGTSVACVGDVDGDGFPDVVVGAPGFSNGQVREGRAQLHLGSSSGLGSSPEWTVEGEQDYAFLGQSVASGGDVNGDGFDDVLVGAPFYDNGEVDEGQAHLYLGNGGDGTGPHASPLALHAVRPGTTTPIAPGLWSMVAGELDVAGMARSPFGRTRAKLQIEAKPLGTAFDGTGLVTSSTWIDTGTAGATIQGGVDSLVSTQGVHWRARLLFDPARASLHSASAWMVGGAPGEPLGVHVWPKSPDADGDGDPDATDCDDNDASIYTGATEVCDAVDNDCDGVADNGFDVDGDGFTTCGADGDANTTADNDCDDGAATAFPGGTESCADGLDNDCDGATDVADSECSAYTDLDGDGYCVTGIDLNADADCIDVNEQTGDTDCDEANAAINSGATEIVGSGVDEDCDGGELCFPDADQDGYRPDGAATVTSTDSDCSDAGEALSTLPTGDCDDTEPDVYPGAPEICDGLDNPCVGASAPAIGPGSGEWDDDLDQFIECAGFVSTGQTNTQGELLLGGEDCDDGDDAVYPGASELCDGVDNDCSGSVPPNETTDADADGSVTCADCDDSNAAVNPSATETCNALDDDCDTTVDDGFDVDGDGVTTCGPDGLAGNADDDCDDTESTVNTAAPELCSDGLDNDCDGLTDAADPACSTLADSDGDGFCAGGVDNNGDGDCADPGEASGSSYDCDEGNVDIYAGAPELCDGLDGDCDGTLPADEADADADGEAICAGDCVDTDATINTSATEICDAVDNDCDTDLDEGFDVDGDGFTTCGADGLLSTADDDCDDTAATAYPGASELCTDGLDNDCDGDADEADSACIAYVDGDGDQVCPLGLDSNGDGDCADSGEQTGDVDCDDTNAAVSPLVTESCDGIDNDCDVQVDEGFDVDGDAFTSCGGDCDDTDAAVNPLATEVCNGVDDDCDTSLLAGEVDGDSDGELVCAGDCDDTDATINTSASELCDGVDQDCDGTADNGFDLDGDGVTTCAGDCDDTDAAVNPSAVEACSDGVDNECDGAIDGADSDCTLLVDSDGDGVCPNGVDNNGDGDCDDGGEQTGEVDCNESDPSINSLASELCDGLDTDCDGAVPADEADGDNDGEMICAGDCDDTASAVNTSATEVCNGTDDDCDGTIDDGFDVDGDGVTTCAGDCDDTDSAIFPAATDLADDGIDQDCSGADTVTCLVDGDGDGIGATATVQDPDGDCTDDAGQSGTPGDCDDADPLAYPGASEIVDDGIDQDCSGTDTVTCFVDGDGDGVGTPATVLAADGDCADLGESTLATDCDDSDSAVFPGAPEQCDAVDSNCDGDLVDQYTNSDTDALPDCIDTDDDDDGFPDGVDCGPTDPGIYPLAPETCDGIDSDCDGSLVDGDPDTDGDGIPDCVDVDGDGDSYDASVDCDDADANINPGATEIPDDGIDQDCSGSDAVTCFVDGDGDTFGTSSTLVSPDDDCTDPGESGVDTDCDDAVGTVFPGASEIADDGIDQDCSGTDTVTCFVDGDGDGVGSASTLLAADGDCVDAGEAGIDGDCDDTDAGVYPTASEVADDGIDQDCTGADAVTCFDDLDGDGFGSPSTTVDPDGLCTDDAGQSAVDTDCDDNVALVFPGAVEIVDDGIDQDCSGSDAVTCFEDLDGDGFGGSSTLEDTDGDCTDDPGQSDVDTDCDDADAAFNPGATEVCDAIDHDCDGDVVDDFEDTDGDAEPDCTDEDDDNDLFDDQVDCDPLDDTVFPNADELCDDIDQDCDGDILEDWPDVNANELPDCMETDDDADGVPAGDGAADDCDDSDPFAYPGAPELCDDVDNDCDGDIDEEDEHVDWFADADGDGFGDPDSPHLDNPTCEDVGVGWVIDASDCDDADPAVHPDAEEICNELDDDCDGVVDVDADGASVCGDCDGVPNPAASETECADGLDNDCDGFIDEADAECAASGCTDCGASVSGSEEGAWVWLALVAVAGRRRRAR